MHIRTNYYDTYDRQFHINNKELIQSQHLTEEALVAHLLYVNRITVTNQRDIQQPRFYSFINTEICLLQVM
jgi:hypothetical protein